MAAAEKQPVTITCAGPLNGALSGVLTWVDQRFPLMSLWRDHLAEYYAPKNFNFWYYFGSLAMLVLVLQIVTGIFLTMHYKPDAAQAFASVEYIMRDVPGGWLIRYMHSTGASAFFIVVYLHMFRGLMYGSYRKPRELIWIFGMLIYLCLMAEAFFGYLLPWGQMSYWGAQVIVNLFDALPVDRARPLAVDPRRLRGVGRDAEPLLRVPRDRDPAGAAGARRRAHHGAARGGLEQSRRRRDQESEGPEDRPPGGRHPVPPVLHGQGHARRGGVLDRVLRDPVLHAGDGRLLPRVQQLHPGRPAEDAAAHRAGVVLHAVLLDPARDHRGFHVGARARR